MVFFIWYICQDRSWKIIMKRQECSFIEHHDMDWYILRGQENQDPLD